MDKKEWEIIKKTANKCLVLRSIRKFGYGFLLLAIPSMILGFEFGLLVQWIFLIGFLYYNVYMGVIRFIMTKVDDRIL